VKNVITGVTRFPPSKQNETTLKTRFKDIDPHLAVRAESNQHQNLFGRRHTAAFHVCKREMYLEMHIKAISTKLKYGRYISQRLMDRWTGPIVFGLTVNKRRWCCIKLLLIDLCRSRRTLAAACEQDEG